MTKETDMHWKHIYHSPNHTQLERRFSGTSSGKKLIGKAYLFFKFLQEKHAKVSRHLPL